MKESKAFKLFYICQFKKIKRSLIRRYLSYDPELNQLSHLTPKELQTLFQLRYDQAKAFVYFIHNHHSIQQYYEEFCRLSPITIYDHDYPEELKYIPDPPLTLYWKGQKSLLKTNKISVIGSRKPSPSAKDKINLFLKPVVESNTTIVSGLAYGIDSFSHEYAIKHNGQTIAVLGFGYHQIYPVKHKPLMEQIFKEGLVISEYPPNEKPQKWYFPERNRIISGLSSATLIIEAAERSGTMITADQALEQGKEVFVVPDSIFLPQAQGCLKLLQEGSTPLINRSDLENWLSTNRHQLSMQNSLNPSIVEN
ncbi:DNA-processing protein DprA [Aquisalibacillus elongatus]|uniref:DNA processing protein n=1 Tax=Aquisalibacillus elongatus TaxID=485577 RepID=A0A3N5BEX5_9BACI|nr:DNA-processing protein DprA [Aquisalibacillus elongatus]RPF56007.1 DNA processing protein [Aquisalibacillus elongatus]